MNRARSIRTIEDLNAVSSSPVIGMDAYADIQNHFKTIHGVDVIGFDKKDLFAVKATMAGFDDMLREFPEATAKINVIKYTPQLKAMGDIDRQGRVRIGSKGLQDYGTGVHETAHALDYQKSNPGTNTFSRNIVELARKDLGLKQNSREYRDLAMMLTGDFSDAGDPAEVFAYAIETAKGGVNNKLANAIYARLKGANG